MWTKALFLHHAREKRKRGGRKFAPSPVSHVAVSRPEREALSQDDELDLAVTHDELKQRGRSRPRTVLTHQSAEPREPRPGLRKPRQQCLLRSLDHAEVAVCRHESGKRGMRAQEVIFQDEARDTRLRLLGRGQLFDVQELLIDSLVEGFDLPVAFLCQLPQDNDVSTWGVELT